MTKLFITLQGKEIEALSSFVKAESFFAVGVELRLDTLENLSLEKIKAVLEEARHHSLQVIVTLRPERQGGFFQGSEAERLTFLEKICALHPEFVDLEYDVPENFKQKLSIAFPKIRWVCSYHDFEKTPEDLSAVLNKMLSSYAHIYKIACLSRSSLDALHLLKWVLNNKKDHHLIGIGMGEYGKITRILAPIVGNFLTFAGESYASLGQISFAELKNCYHFPSLNEHTEIFALIGGSVSHSLSPQMHNTAFSRAKKNACYVPISLKIEELSSFLREIVELPFKGLSVTMPFKQVILPYLDALEPSAQQCHSVNTVTIKEKRLIGSNTDGSGALKAIEKHLSLQGKKVVIIGAGGAAHAIAYEARERGAVVVILNRTVSKALELSASVGCLGGGLDLLPTLFAEGYDLLIHATPHSEEVIDSRFILASAFVMDIVTFPEETFLIKEAKKKGCPVIYGKEMLAEQAVLQQQSWLRA